MPSIDERIVAMSFENRKFEAAVGETMKTLSKLDSTLQSIGAKNSLADIEKAANKVTLTQPMSALDKLQSRLFGASRGAAEGFGGIQQAGDKVTLESPLTALDKLRTRLFGVSEGASQGFSDISRASESVDFRALDHSIDSVQSHFSALTVVATSALSTITMDAVRRGKTFLTSFAFGPITQGLEEYKTNLSSIQTILANTQGQKVSGLDNVNKALSQLNTYSDKTIYNFSQMAKNIGTFTAAGVDLPKSVAAIKGIANLAALSGSNSQQAATAMYQLSQAIAAGRVGLQDWNSVVNAGMGGAVFQKSLMRTAENMGALEKGAVKIDKATGKATVNGESFRTSIMAKPGEQSWLTSDVLTKTLSQFTGDLSDAQLKAQGFSDSQIEAIQAQAKTAQAAATEVKNLSQVFDVAKETIGSGWSRTFQLIFGDFNESKKTFTELSNAVNGAINTLSKARNKVLGEWKKLGGRTDLIAGIKNAFTALGAVLKPIRNAFHDIFPHTTGKQLADLTKQFRVLMAHLKIGPKTADLLRRTFRGLFALLDIGRKIVGGIVSAFFHMFGIIGKGSGGFLSFTATVGDALVIFRDWLVQGDRLKKFFSGLASVIAAPAKLIANLFSAIGDLFNTDVGSNTVDSVNGLNKALDPMARLAQAAQTSWEGLKSVLHGIASILKPIVDVLGNALSTIGDAISHAFDEENVSKFLAGLQVGLIGGIFLAIKKAIGGGVGFNFKAEIGGLSDALKVMTGSLSTMQRAVQAATLLEIAAAVGILAISVAILSRINAKKLTESMTAMSVGLAELVGAMSVLGRSTGKGIGFVKLPVIAGAMIIMAGAIGILAISMLALSTMDWDQIGKGLTAVTGLLAGLSVAVRPMSKAGPTLVLTSVGIIAISAAMILLAGAMKIFATMKWEEIGKGLAAVAGGLTAIGLGTRFLGPQLLLVGPALIAAAVGLNLLAGSMKIFATLKWEEIGKGVVAIAGGLTAIALAMNLMPLTLPITAAGLVVLGVALTAITGVIALLGHMKVSTLATGIIAMGAALGVLAIGLTAMAASLPGAAALLIASTALGIFAPTLALLGTLSWGTIGKGLLVVAASLLVIGTAGLFAAPALTALGYALTIVGVGVLAIGGGVRLMSEGFAKLGSTGAKGLAVFLTSLTAFIALIPSIAISFVKGLVEIAESVVKLAPPLIKAFGEITGMLIEQLIKQVPRFEKAIEVFIGSFTKLIIKETPKVVNAAFALILGLLKGLDLHIGEITERAVSIITQFLDGLAKGMPEMSRAGANLIIKFLEGLTQNIRKIVAKGLEVIAKMIEGIGQGAGRLITSGADAIASVVKGMGNAAWRIVKAGINAATTFIKNMALEIPRQVDKVATAVINMINRLAKVVRERAPEFTQALFNLGASIVVGIIAGLASLPGAIISKILSAVSSAINLIPGPIRDALGISGTVNKIAPFHLTLPPALRPRKHPKKTVSDAVSNIRLALGDNLNVQPKITPVLDLSEVRREAKKMPKLTAPTGLSTDATLRHARALLAEKADADRVHHTETGKHADRPITFVQNNHSPESLPEREIYRRTHNQLSKVKAEMRRHHAHK